MSSLDDPRTRRRGPRWTAAATGVVGAVLVGAVGTGIALVNERDRVRQRDEQAAATAAAAIADRLARSTTGLQGVNGLAADGTVTEAEFTAFAGDVLDEAMLISLGWVVPVAEADRAAFEARTGRPVIERGDDGRFRPAARRPAYAVVRAVVPENDTTRATLGFDITSDPIRKAAADRAVATRAFVLSEPVRLAPSGRPGYFLIQPIFGPDRTLVGYVSTGIAADTLLAGAREQLPPGTGIGLRDGGRDVAVVPDPDAWATVTVNGRPWEIGLAHPTGADPLLPMIIAATTLLFGGMAGGLAVRESRLDRARRALAEQVAENAARSERLADVARRLSAVEHLDDVVRVISAQLPTVVGADAADIGLVLEGDHLRMLAGAELDLDADLVERYRTVPFSVHLPTTAAVRERQLVLVDDLTTWQHDDPVLRADAAAAGLRSVAATPLLDANGEPVGVVALAWRSVVDFDPALVSVISTLGELCGQTLERAVAADRRQAFIVALQRRLLPAPPLVGDFEIIARYQPAADAVGMGGDWYQFLRLDDGSLVVVLGDVVGHGVEAIATMTQIQYVIAAAVHTGVELPEIFAFVQHALDIPDAAYATALLLHLDPSTDRLGWVSAGHPYPLLRRPDGTTAALTESQHPLLGFTRRRTELSYVDFPPGSTVLAYTDGLIERRNRAINAGIEALRGEFTRLDGDRARGLDTLIENSLRLAAVDDGVDDDIAVVLIHRAGPA